MQTMKTFYKNIAVCKLLRASKPAKNYDKNCDNKLLSSRLW